MLLFLICLAFYSWQNRQTYSQLSEDVKPSAIKESPVRLTGKGKGKGDVKLASKDTNSDGSQVKDGASTGLETYKSFCVRFVRLNGILFTRTRYLPGNFTMGIF